MKDERTVDPDEEVVDAGTPPKDPDVEPEVEIVSFGDDDDAAEVAATAGSTAALRSELDQERDRYLRLRADFDNYRKRMERDREELSRTSLAAPMRELLPVVDNLERALAAPGSAEDVRGGVELIARQFSEVLRRFGLAEVPALGQPFDPRLHEAVSREESDEVDRPTVVAEFQRGYWLNDRLLRPAMVRVAVPRESNDSGAEPDGPHEVAR